MAEQKRDYYEVLGVDKNASLDEITNRAFNACNMVRGYND